MITDENPFEKKLESISVTISGNEKLADKLNGLIHCWLDCKIFDLDDKVPVISELWLDKDGPQKNYGLLIVEKAHLKKQSVVPESTENKECQQKK